MAKEQTENLAEFYFRDLYTTNTPVRNLTGFLCSVLNKKAERGDYSRIGRLVKMYGREAVFFTILDVYDFAEKVDENYYPLLVSMCKKRLKRKYDQQIRPEYQDFDSLLKSLERKRKKIEKTRKISDG
jgi:hypothetical protein